MRFEKPGPSETFLLDIGEEPQAGNISRGSLFISSGGNTRGQQLLKQP
jgi:hypothetical protein